MAYIFCKEFSECQSLKNDTITYRSSLPVQGRDYFDTLDYIELSDKTVEDALSRINHHKPPGLDCIPALFFKRIRSTLAPIVSYAFIASLFMGPFPDVLKQSTVLPLYKCKGKLQTRAVNAQLPSCPPCQRFSRNLSESCIFSSIRTSPAHSNTGSGTLFLPGVRRSNS